MTISLWRCYAAMYTARLFEEGVTGLWQNGLISGEMHLSTGEEAITAGTVLQLRDGDAMALDHRGTAAMLMRGVEPMLLLREFMGHRDGLCRGQGGHMHLFAKQYLAASSGIVGASGPAAVGFALAGRYLRPGSVALAFFGDGALNQGMLMESINLAVVWNLPVLFVCKDSKWAITTRSATVTGATIPERAAGFGIPVDAVDGSDVEAVWKAAAKALERARKGKGPAFIHATCTHPEGHFLGDPLLRIVQHPVKELKKVAGPIVKSATTINGASIFKRSGSLATVTALIGKTAKERFLAGKDPLKALRSTLTAENKRLTKLEHNIETTIRSVFSRGVAASHPTPDRGMES